MKDKINEETDKRAYSTKEIAHFIGVSNGHVRNEIMRGKLKALKSGRRILITREEIQRYLSELAK